ncbi:hypothetical protein HDIA_1352 [Hartmannibacter diazotrophicus]|uniref:DUF2793 domain-containing protein n=1 Tax=Hartmannibacter diazotrophicus TaxID=1482074 RepID=A0A2C9D3T9_9HYPH|nr:DUF2793 domain-containing protein [Hartmannibacter diazotrophicus]SON54893.1 hypothetical protein HDIA_1352 [Hartmannibacter diazotrophicus]
MTGTARIGLPLLAAAQAQKHVTHNEALVLIDALMGLSLKDRDLASPPSSPDDGDCYLVAAAATGGWAGKDGMIAYAVDGDWRFAEPATGQVAYVADEGLLAIRRESDWLDLSPDFSALEVATIGIGTGPDAGNPLSAKLNNILFTALESSSGGDGDLRFKLNKETSSDTVSQLYQVGYSGRAEVGLLGDAAFSVKVSPDGSNWLLALSIDPVDGAMSLSSPLGIASGGTGAGTKATARKALGLARPNVPQRNHVTGNAWLSSTSAADNLWQSVTWSPDLGLFCAVAGSGSGSRVMTSPDGIAWTNRTSAADNDWRDLCWAEGLGLFVGVAATGSGDRVMTSPDGATWSVQSSPLDVAWESICWSEELGLLCAVASSGSGSRVMTSPDAIAWTSRASAADNDWTSVCWSAELGLFCAVAATGSGNRVMTSPDGGAWTNHASAADNDWRSVCWSAELGLFCAVAATGSGNRVMTSPDGIAWTSRTSAADNDWQSVCWSAELGLFCAVATTGTGSRVMTSPDGISWTLRTSAADNEWRSVCWSSDLGLFGAVAASGSSDRAMTSVSAHSYPYRG